MVGRLESMEGVYHVCDTGTLPDVRRAIVQSRLTEVVIGCMNPKAGCAGSILNLLEMDRFNHQVQVTRGVLEEECSVMLSQFFKDLREKKKKQKKNME